MLNKKTVLIVGAGASVEYGLPSGLGLIAQISQLFDVEAASIGAISPLTYVPAQELHEPIRRLCDRFGAQEIASAIKKIARGVYLATSIDNFIKTHSQQEAVVAVGKLAIAYLILKAEEASYVAQQHRRIENNRPTPPWICAFAKMLFSDALPADVFSSVRIVCFNYDRCIEHFLFHALQDYFGLDRASASTAMERLKIHHPYGMVGSQPWSNQRGETFGGISQNDVLAAADSIKTFHEQEFSPSHQEIREAMDWGERFVFLGYGFHRQNMDLLRPSGPWQQTKDVYATTFQVTQPNADEFRNRIENYLYQGDMRQRSSNATFFNGPCNQIFGQYENAWS